MPCSPRPGPQAGRRPFPSDVDGAVLSSPLPVLKQTNGTNTYTNNDTYNKLLLIIIVIIMIIMIMIVIIEIIEMTNK